MSNTISDQAVFGAQVVSKTLDYLNGRSGSDDSGAINSREEFGAAVVSKTLDYMNNGATSKKSGGYGSVSDSYNFNMDVLGSYFLGKGAIASASA